MRWRAATGRSTCSSASSARSSRRPRRGGGTSTRTSASATASRRSRATTSRRCPSPSSRSPSGRSSPPRLRRASSVSARSRTLWAVNTATLRNIAIVLALAAAVYFVPGGGETAALIGALLSTAILASFVLLAARFYRERRMDIVGLGDRWRALFYGAIGAIVLAMAARPRLIVTGAGTLLWLAVVAGSA